MSERRGSDDSSLALTAGTRVGHFEIVRELGRGGMGIVYRARDLDLPREVALKRPWPEISESPVIEKRFQREARAASTLLHPNIVPVLEVFEDLDSDWIVMELVEGESLRDRLRDKTPLPVRDILANAEGLADALKFAHSKGILHRDINPKNILLDRRGAARLTDFGLARFLPSETGPEVPTTSLTGEGVIVGTLAYMSPEQALGRETDPRSDLFSLGVVFYEMCTGELPFPASAHGDLLDAILHREPTPIARLNYAIPEEIERIVRKCMRKWPDERYQTADELLADLRALRHDLDVASVERETTRRRSRLPWLVAGAALAAAVALGALWVFSEPDERPLPVASSTRQITAAPGWEAEPALSPDGSLIAYASDESGNPDIWIIDIRGGNPLRLTEDPAVDRSPAWLPDGSAILFVSERSGRPDVWKVPRLGGSATMVLPDATDPAPSPDGLRVAFSRPDASSWLRIGLAPIDEPEGARLITGHDDGAWSHRTPVWSPDGGHLCYAATHELWIVDVGEGVTRRLTRGLEDMEPAWSPDGRHVYFSSARGGTFAIWRVSVRDGSVEQLTPGSGPERKPSISPDGSSLVYSTLVEDPDLMVVDLETGQRHRLSALGTEFNAGFAPDGSELAFISSRWGQIAMWVQPLLEGSPAGTPRQLTDHPGTAANPAYSPDGQWIAYHRVLDGQRHIWSIPSTGGTPLRITDEGSINIQPSWSPDARALAFVSEHEQGFELRVRPVRDGAPSGPSQTLLATDSQILGPSWSPDGSRLAFIWVREDDGEVYVIPREGGDASAKVTSGAGAFQADWETDQMLLVSGRWQTGRLTLRRVPAAGGVGQELDPPIDFGPEARFGDFDLAFHGRWLVFTSEERRLGDLWTLESERGSY